MGKSQEIRGNRKARLIGKTAGWLIRLVTATMRVEIVDNAGVSDGRHPGSVVYSLWHNRIFCPACVLRKKLKGRTSVVLTSASKDGAILESAMAVFGTEAARGSSSRRGAAALVALRKAIKAGKDVTITPDGPRGPVYVVQPGVVKLSQASRAPIVIVDVELSNYWQLGTWDKFRIPKPFSKVKVTLNEPMVVPAELSEEEFEQVRLDLEKRMEGD